MDFVLALDFFQVGICLAGLYILVGLTIIGYLIYSAWEIVPRRDDPHDWK